MTKRRGKPGHRPVPGGTNRPRFWGRHAVTAALANPERTVRKLWVTREAAQHLDIPATMSVLYADVADLGRMVPPDAPHQGVVAEVDPLEDIWLGDLLEQGADDQRPLLVLDQVTDPHNVGAILRSAVALGAGGLLTTTRHAPTEGGVLAKAASGAVDLLPIAAETNLSRAVAALRERGFTAIGLDSEAGHDLEDVPVGDKVVLVLGAEGKGVRPGVRAGLDAMARLSAPGAIASLNVSNAAAIALYAIGRRLRAASR